MSASKHTPGPWLYRGKSDAVYTIPSDPAYQYGSQIFRFYDEEGPNEDDLNLILAAPDLLKALVALDNYVNNHLISDYPTGIDLCSLEFKNARAAIAKATGSAA